MKLLFATSLFVFLFLTSLSFAKLMPPAPPPFAKPRPPSPATIPPPSPSNVSVVKSVGRDVQRQERKIGASSTVGYAACQECKCVPSGTFGNKSECPCYRDKLNSKGHPKCP
ncbi:hypothetical protein GQ457_05G013610 [Hibiscus cannabinus]